MVRKSAGVFPSVTECCHQCAVGLVGLGEARVRVQGGGAVVIASKSMQVSCCKIQWIDGGARIYGNVSHHPSYVRHFVVSSPVVTRAVFCWKDPANLSTWQIEHTVSHFQHVSSWKREELSSPWNVTTASVLGRFEELETVHLTARWKLGQVLVNSKSPQIYEWGRSFHSLVSQLSCSLFPAPYDCFGLGKLLTSDLQ